MISPRDPQKRESAEFKNRGSGWTCTSQQVAAVRQFAIRCARQVNTRIQSRIQGWSEYIRNAYVFWC